MKAEARRRHARWSLRAWYAQIPISFTLYVVASPKVFVAYLVGISVWTGIETAHSRLNADLE